MAEFKLVPVKEIKADPNQPRKFYDERAMGELELSIKNNGVLQPILLRKNGKGYLIVCGERRYRAASAAGLKEIPSVIRDISDDEALQMQIIENLQRKDVHPMEEAVAFKSLSEKFTDEEIALRVGKSASYVAKRVKLNDLIPLAQEVFYAGKMTYTDALAFSRIDAEVQQEILAEELPDDWKKRSSDWVLDDLGYLIGQHERELKNTVFKLNDAKLYPEAGACSSCAFNSANQPLLFDDGKKKVCNKPSCFHIKTQRAYKQKFEKIAADPNVICVVLDSYLNEDEKQQLKAAIECGIKPLDRKLWDRFYGVPEPTMSFEAWKEDYQDQYDEDITPAELNNEYNEYKADNDKDVKEYETLLKEGRLVKAFVVAGNNAGKEVVIKLNSEEAKSIVDTTAGNAGDAYILEEIAKIEMREKRNKELDAEKVWTAVRTAFLTQDEKPEDVEDDYDNVWSLHDWVKNYGYADITRGEIKNIAAAFLYENISWQQKDELEKALFGEEDPEQEKLFEYFFGYNASPNFNKIMQFFILDKSFPLPGSEDSDLCHKASMQLARTVFKKGVAKAELEQHEAAEQRQQRVTKRIDALRKKLSEQPSEAAPKKSTSKK